MPVCLFVLICGSSPLSAQTSLAVDDLPYGPWLDRLQGHRALYDLTLVGRRDNSDIDGASGQMQFQWADACDGWTISHKSQISLSRLDGAVMNFGWQLSTWEAKDGLTFRFIMKRFSESGQDEEVRGEALLEARGGAGIAHYTLPAEQDVPLPEGTLFPTWHSLSVLNALERQSLPLMKTVFDGTAEEGGLSEISVFPAADRFQPVQNEGLLDQKSWGLNLAYFSVLQQESAPLHEQQLRIFQNGVVETFVFDYGEFSIAATLRDLEYLPVQDCS
ncbi:EipB family protein [Rhodovibrionaceae bacterium A322]